MDKSLSIEEMDYVDLDFEEDVEQQNRTRRQPRYHVVLWDDDAHTHDYVIRMMRVLFGHDAQRGYEIAHHVDTRGSAICLTTTMEHAELKRDQIRAFGRDRAIRECSMSMSATIEAED